MREDDDYSGILGVKINVQKLLDKLKINDIIDAALDQPTQFKKAAQFYAKRALKTKSIKAELEFVEAKAAMRYRRTASVKITDSYLTTRLSINKDVRKLRKLLLQAVVIEEFAKNTLDMYRMRRDSLKILINTDMVERTGGQVKLNQNNMRQVADNLREKYRRVKQVDDDD